MNKNYDKHDTASHTHENTYILWKYAINFSIIIYGYEWTISVCDDHQSSYLTRLTC